MRSFMENYECQLSSVPFRLLIWLFMIFPWKQKKVKQAHRNDAVQSFVCWFHIYFTRMRASVRILPSRDPLHKTKRRKITAITTDRPNHPPPPAHKGGLFVTRWKMLRCVRWGPWKHVWNRGVKEGIFHGWRFAFQQRFGWQGQVICYV